MLTVNIDQADVSACFPDPVACILHTPDLERDDVDSTSIGMYFAAL